MTNQLQTQGKKQDIRELLQSDRVKQQLALVLPKHLTADRMARVACTAVLKTPKLMDCRPESLLQALMLCSQAGLEPDGRNAHLIPYGDQVQVIFDYKGLVALAERNGVKNIRAMAVCEADEFSFSVEDGAPKLHHVINWRKPRGEAYAFYATCIRNDQFDVEVMTKEEIDAIRKRSRASGNGPWVTDYSEMSKKTVLRRMSKRWDLSSEVADAVNADDDTPNFQKMPLPTAQMPDFSAPAIEEGATELAPEPVKEPPQPAAPLKPRGPRAPKPAPAAPQAAKPAPVGETVPAETPEPSPAPTTDAATPLGELQNAMSAAEVYSGQVLSFYNQKVRGQNPEVAELAQLPPQTMATLTKALRQGVPDIIKAIKAFDPV